MFKVFVSSTVYDLLDARAEVEQLLRDMRLVPVLSGSATSGFQPLPDQNSIETCLTNLRQCDAVIVILCQRYGPSLQDAGFPDLSATHLEYEEAKKLGKPVYMYVRDRLEADYSIYKKNKESDLKLVWVRQEEDHRLFALLDEHRKLVHDRQKSNWFDTFRDSLELKTLIKRDLGPIASRDELKALIVENRVPIIAVDVDAVPSQPGIQEVIVNIHFRNVGTVPAYQLAWSLDGFPTEHKIPVLAPQEATHLPVIATDSWEHCMTVDYFMPQGHSVRDKHTVSLQFTSETVFWTGAVFKAKTYHVATGDVRPFAIADPE